MKMGLKALLPVSAFGLCLAITGCNSEEAPLDTTPPPAPPAATAEAEAPSSEAPPAIAPAEEPAAEEPKIEAPAEEPATP